MGNTGSVRPNPLPETNSNNITLPFEHIVDYVMPIYFTKVELLPSYQELLVSSWRMIITNNAKGFNQLKKEHPDSTPCATSMEFFSNRFVHRLVEVHPVCQPMFSKSSLKQGTLFMNMFSFLIKELDNPEATKKQLLMLASSHTKMGIRATEFGIFGEVLFWTLRLVLGKEDYDVVTHTAWIQFYSGILNTVVPLVLRHEIQHRTDMKALSSKRMAPSTHSAAAQSSQSVTRQASELKLPDDNTSYY